MIAVTDLVKQYGAVRAVDGLSFEVAEGEVFGLLGPNGAGKTTTISMLSTQLKPTSGTARVGGRDIRTDGAAVRRCIGVVPQEIALYEDLTARENLDFWGRLYGLDGSALGKRSEELLEFAELQAHARSLVKTFSGGMKRRLNLVLGLIHAPKLLFLDEPTVGIDAQARERILELIRQMNDEGMTVLYTTHYLEEAERLCDRIGVIDRGALAALGDKDELIGQIGDVDIVRFRLEPAKIEAFIEACDAWDESAGAKCVRGKVVVRASNGAVLLDRARKWLEREGQQLLELEVERPNLETLYLKLTGRDLRE